MIHFEAFGLQRHIKLERNDKLLSANARLLITDGEDKATLARPSDQCHFLHNSDGLSAALSNCQDPSAYLGQVIQEGQVLDIKPLHSRFNEVLGLYPGSTYGSFK